MNKEWMAEEHEEDTWMDVFAGETFGAMCDRFIRVLLVFAGVAGIPYTMYLLLQILFSL
ncbi:DUF3930 family protein [Ectobacillus ponti]|uniref:DUF3930 family protein n=1 Tax=Ectobacillus ponti TaxID=2961894 RepID=A0AA41XCD6_9BACI|nr:DUF3930 family protein [Ectobacillus ponti]MCP8970335.1 DUF3930 family protein [Ectobacillus ponti]